MPVHYDTAGKAYDAVRRSRDRLGVETIDFYHIWCIRHRDHYRLAMKPGGQYEGLLRAKEEGLIRHIVCSTHLPGNEISEIVDDGKVEGVLLGVNAINFPYRWAGVRRAAEKGLGVVAMNPLAGGLIPRNEERFAFLAEAGESATRAARRFLAGSPEITVTLVGFTAREHIDIAAQVGETARPAGAEPFGDKHARPILGLALIFFEFADFYLVQLAIRPFFRHCGFSPKAQSPTPTYQVGCSP